MTKAIGAFFADDHAKLDAIFADLRQRLATVDQATVTAARPRFDEFATGLRRHIVWEEEILFPGVEAIEPGLRHGPGRVMRAEHQEIQRLLTVADEQLAEFSPAAAKAAAATLRQLHAVLREHNDKEEAVYYPMADNLFSAPDADALLARVKAHS